MSAPSFRDLAEIGRAEYLLRRSDLDMQAGAVSDVMNSASAAMGDRILGFAAKRFATTYLDSAKGDDLELLVWDHWRRQRQPAVAANGALTFTRASGGAAVTVLANTRVATDPNTRGDFLVARTNADLVFGPGDVSLTVPATMDEAGRAGNVAAGALRRLLDTVPGFTVQNQERFIGGAPAQSDDELRESVRSLELTRQRATIAAVEFGATQVPTVRAATVVEDPVTFLTTVYVTDADGSSNAQMVQAVEAELRHWRGAGALVQVVGGDLQEVAIAVSLTVRAGVDAAALAGRVRTAIVAAVNRLAIGATLYRSLIQAAARAVDTAAIVEVEVLEPAANLAPEGNQVLRTTQTLVSVG